MLKSRFLALPFGFNEADWEVLQTAYTGSNRHYHNLQHLEAMLKGLDDYPGLIGEKALLEAAIFYHDIVYNPLRSDNEHQSGLVAQTLLTSKGMATLKSEKIYSYILATKTHQTGESPDADLDLLLDLDLAILGTAPENYSVYTQQIRKEYWMYPGPVYRAGRRKAMARFLEQPRIFKTDFYYERWEETARRNIEAELR